METWGPGIQVDDTWPTPPTQTLLQTKFTSSWQQQWPPINGLGNNSNWSARGCYSNDVGICHYIRWWRSFPQKHEISAIISNNHAVMKQTICISVTVHSCSLWCLPYHSASSSIDSDVLLILDLTWLLCVMLWVKQKTLRFDWPENWDAFVEICISNHCHMWCGSHMQK